MPDLPQPPAVPNPTHEPNQPSPGQQRRMRRALWVALVLVAIWGANFSVQKAVFNAITPGGFLFVRYLIAVGASHRAVRAMHSYAKRSTSLTSVGNSRQRAATISARHRKAAPLLHEPFVRFSVCAPARPA